MVRLERMSDCKGVRLQRFCYIKCLSRYIPEKQCFPCKRSDLVPSGLFSGKCCIPFVLNTVCMQRVCAVVDFNWYCFLKGSLHV